MSDLIYGASLRFSIFLLRRRGRIFYLKMKKIKSTILLSIQKSLFFDNSSHAVNHVELLITGSF